MIDIDIEVYSDADLPTVGSVAYAKHYSTEILCMAYKIDNKEIKITIVLDKKETNHYFFFKFLFYGSLSIGSYTILFVLKNPFLFVLDFVLFGFVGVLLCFNFADDFSHHSIFKRPFWDNLPFEFIYTTMEIMKG